MKNNRLLRWLAFTLLLAAVSAAAIAGTDNMAGTWDSLTLTGSFGFIAPKYQKFHWTLIDQGRWRDDSSQGFRLNENLVWLQFGYDLTPHASLWLGYTHDWLHPLNKPSFHENRAYEDFLYNHPAGPFTFTSRTRLEQRVNQSSGDVGNRIRELVQLRYPFPFNPKLSIYAGDEALVYLNKNSFGPSGFSEDRAFGGLSYKFTKHVSADLGYLGQYIVVKPGDDNFTHNVLVNVTYQF